MHSIMVYMNNTLTAFKTDFIIQQIATSIHKIETLKRSSIMDVAPELTTLYGDALTNKAYTKLMFLNNEFAKIADDL